jgi:hypothetical protein
MRTTYICALILVLSAGAALAETDPMKEATNDVDQQKATIDKICSSAPSKDQQASDYSDVLAKTLLLSDDQKKALKDYEDTQAKAIADARSRICDHKPDLSTFDASLSFRQKMLEDQLETVKAVNPKLIAFYNGLNSEQKAKFDQMRQTMASRKHR